MITNENNGLNIDDSKLNQFDTTRISAGDLSSTNKRGVIMGVVANSAGDQAVVNEDGTEVNEQQDSTEVAEEETDEEQEQQEDDSSPFAQQFESTFGVKPQEAVELVNSLQAFRDEQTLMRSWGVDPVTYDERMTQVREFYKTLPEDGREKFNTIEGANAIWTHLQESGRVKEQKKTNKTTATSRVKRQQQKPTYDFKRSEITRMPREEYQQKLPAIVKAFQSGRVLDD